LPKWEHDQKFPRGQAIEFLRQTIRKYPGEVILLTIGPLTNIGLLFKADAEIPSLLKGIVMMCGLFTNRLAGVGPLEWNARGDPHATAIVYQAATGMHRSIGMDVTCQVTMNAKQVKEKLHSDLHQPVLDFAEVWFQQRDLITFHDPLAATTIFDDQVCVFKKGTVEVELISEKLKGMTLWKPDSSEKHEVALEVDSRRFFEQHFSVFQ